MLGNKFLQRTWSSAKRWCSKSDSHEWHRSSVSRVQEGTGGWVRTSRVKNHAKNNSKSLFDALESKPSLFFVDIHSSLIDHVRRRSFIKFRLSLGNNIERTLNISLLLLYFFFTLFLWNMSILLIVISTVCSCTFGYYFIDTVLCKSIFVWQIT